jgi:hypothetical protein
LLAFAACALLLGLIAGPGSAQEIEPQEASVSSDAEADSDSPHPGATAGVKGGFQVLPPEPSRMAAPAECEAPAPDTTSICVEKSKKP